MSSVFVLFRLLLAPHYSIARTAADDAAVALISLRTKLRSYVVCVLMLADITACDSPAVAQQFGSVTVGAAGPTTVTFSGSFTDVVPAVLTQGAPNLDFICNLLCGPFRCMLAART